MSIFKRPSMIAINLFGTCQQSIPIGVTYQVIRSALVATDDSRVISGIAEPLANLMSP